jgi:hypothetical protein
MTSGDDGTAGRPASTGRPLPFDTSVAHQARVYDYMLGSYLAISHAAGDLIDQEMLERIKDAWRGKMQQQIIWRTGEQVARFFAGTELVDPGLVRVEDWRPDPGAADRESATQRNMYWVCGVKKPRIARDYPAKPVHLPPPGGGREAVRREGCLPSPPDVRNLWRLLLVRIKGVPRPARPG